MRLAEANRVRIVLHYSMWIYKRCHIRKVYLCLRSAALRGSGYILLFIVHLNWHIAYDFWVPIQYEDVVLPVWVMPLCRYNDRRTAISPQWDFLYWWNLFLLNQDLVQLYWYIVNNKELFIQLMIYIVQSACHWIKGSDAKFIWYGYRPWARRVPPIPHRL